MAKKDNKETRGAVQTSDVTTITINPNISGSGIAYTVIGVDGGSGRAVVATGSALNGPVTVKVSGYDQYNVTFGGNCAFGNSVAIRSGITANVTLAITTTQG